MSKNQRVSLILVLALTIAATFGKSYRRLTFEDKVKEAGLIVLGTATAFGEEVATRDGRLIKRSVRVDVKAVMWPLSYRNTNAIVFPDYVLKTWPKSAWNYSNTAGIYFLKRSGSGETGWGWARLGYLDDWREEAMHAASVRAAIRQLKPASEKP